MSNLNKVILALLLTGILLMVMKNKNLDSIDYQTYRFFYEESTRANNSILLDGELLPITFINARDTEVPLSALLALKWNVLYPNAEGNIWLFGRLNPDDSTFQLIHWQLKTPYEAYEYSEIEMPASDKLVLRESLDIDDFNKPLKEGSEIYTKHIDEILK